MGFQFLLITIDQGHIWRVLKPTFSCLTLSPYFFSPLSFFLVAVHAHFRLPLHVLFISCLYLWRFWDYLAHILCIPCAYLRHIMCISFAYFEHIFDITWTYQGHILIVQYSTQGVPCSMQGGRTKERANSFFCKKKNDFLNFQNHICLKLFQIFEILDFFWDFPIFFFESFEFFCLFLVIFL